MANFDNKLYEFLVKSIEGKNLSRSEGFILRFRALAFNQGDALTWDTFVHNMKLPRSLMLYRR